MATVEEHKQASKQFHEAMVESSHKAFKDFRDVLQGVVYRVAGKPALEQPASVVSDVILGVAKVHVAFRESFLDAAAAAVKAFRKNSPQG